MKLSLYLVLMVCMALLLGVFGRGLWHPMYSKLFGKRSLDDVINLYGVVARDKLKPDFDLAGINYPPENLALLAFKDTDVLELWAQDENDWAIIKTYPIKAASGVSGPKLREGDYQVPEGEYDIVGFNPNSSYHLSMKLNYPNAFDQKWAEQEGRTEPGTNIFIHGKAVSIGCLAMGDEAIEELFVLSHDVSKRNIKVIIAPTDPRINELKPPVGSPPWVSDLYQDITLAFGFFNKKTSTGSAGLK